MGSFMYPGQKPHNSSMQTQPPSLTHVTSVSVSGFKLCFRTTTSSSNTDTTGSSNDDVVKKPSSSTGDNNSGGVSSSEENEPNTDDTVVTASKSEAADKKGTKKRSSNNLTLSVALEQEDIEADIRAISSGKRTKRTKKRDREAQEAIDKTFPGLSLCSMTLDAFRQRYRINGK